MDVNFLFIIYIIILILIFFILNLLSLNKYNKIYNFLIASIISALSVLIALIYINKNINESEHFLIITLMLFSSFLPIFICILLINHIIKKNDKLY
jgi:hypothetical protein